MSRVKLTKAQRAFLTRAAAETYADYSGRGAYIWGRHEMRTANVLRNRDLLSIGAASYAKITPAGLAALKLSGAK